MYMYMYMGNVQIPDEGLSAKEQRACRRAMPSVRSQELSSAQPLRGLVFKDEVKRVYQC